MACHWWPLPLLIAIVAAAAIGGSFVTKTGLFSDGSSSSSSSGLKKNKSQKDIEPDEDAKKQDTCKLRNQYYDDKTKKCLLCPEPDKYFAVFWESQTDGCLKWKNSDSFKYITHVYWGFAEIDEKTGKVDQTFQGNDATMKTCIKSMRSKCVKQLASIGGADNRKRFVKLNTPTKIANFGKTAASLVQKFDFDGIDIDDESGNCLLEDKDWYKHSDNVVNYLKAAKSEMNKLKRHKDEPAYTLTWDEFPESINDNCNKTKNCDWNRCYNKKISDVVDWVNLMMYNSADGGDYDKYISSTVPDKWTKKIPKSKIVLGGCAGKKGDQGACSYGASPSTKQLEKYATEGRKKYLGTMIWTASADFNIYKGKSLKSMGKAGSYGIKQKSSPSKLRYL